MNNAVVRAIQFVPPVELNKQCNGDIDCLAAPDDHHYLCEAQFSGPIYFD